MDAERFDRLVRALTTQASRRRATGGLLAGLLATLTPSSDSRLPTPDLAHGKGRAKRGKKGGGKGGKKDDKRDKRKKKRRDRDTPSQASPNPGGSTGPVLRCATSTDPSFAPSITALPENEVSSCQGLIDRRVGGIYKEEINSQGQWVTTKYDFFLGVAGVTIPYFVLNLSPATAPPSAIGLPTNALPAGFVALQPPWATVCQPTDAAPDPVPNGVVCARANVVFAPTLEQRVYRANWDIPSHGVSPGCRDAVTAFQQMIDLHEGRHWQDHEAIAASYQTEWNQRTCYGCAPVTAGQTPEQTQAQALQALDQNVFEVMAQVNAAMTADATACSERFHVTNPPTKDIVCDPCACTPPAVPCEGVCCASGEACVAGGCVAPDQYRIVLRWGAAPSDLDSHLWLPAASPYHIAYYDEGSAGAFPFAILDHDDTTKFGPETITILQVQPGTYRYAVHNFSDDECCLDTSGATVQLFHGANLVGEWGVPGGDGTDPWWYVFDLGSDGAVTEVNQLQASPPAPYDDPPVSCDAADGGGTCQAPRRCCPGIDPTAGAACCSPAEDCCLESGDCAEDQECGSNGCCLGGSDGGGAAGSTSSRSNRGMPPKSPPRGRRAGSGQRRESGQSHGGAKNTRDEGGREQVSNRRRGRPNRSRRPARHRGDRYAA